MFRTRNLHPASLTSVQTDLGETLLLSFVVGNHFCLQAGNDCQCEQSRHFILTSLKILKVKETHHKSTVNQFRVYSFLQYELLLFKKKNPLEASA